jgi:type 1 glutamine amidotransferase
MMQARITVLMLLAMGSLVCAQNQANEDGWISLFNGKDLTGWKVNEDTGTFSFKDGAIVANGPRSHLFYVGPVNNADFKDFEYKVDVMTEPGSNGGLYFHTQFQGPGWPSKGFEVQVNNSFKADPRMTGSLYQVQDVMNVSPAKDKVWFTEHIIVQGKHVVVFVDGKKVVDWTEPATPDPKLADRKIDHGTFALQGHDPKSTVYYKNIRVKPLGATATQAQPAAEGKWVDLFDGKTLAGWKPINGTAKYEVADGTIKGTTVEGSPNSFLCTEKAYQDFDLEFEVKVDTRLNSGVQFRSNAFQNYQNNRVHGYQVEIAAAGNSGRIYDEARRGGWVDKAPADPKAKDAAFKDGQWNKYRVLCEGPHIQTWINGIPIADVTDAMTAKGFIGLQVHSFKADSPASVQWRNIRIREMAPAKKILQVAFVTGGHDFEEQAFMDMWKSIDGIQVTQLPQKDDSEIFEDISSWPYDVMVLYNMSQNISEKRQKNFKQLVSQGIGLVAVHHNMGAFQGFVDYKDIIGAKFFLKAEGDQKQGAYKHGVEFKVQVADKNHPITKGLSDFVILDETYKYVWHAADNHVLLTTEEPTSDKDLAWTREYGRGKVCTIALGHDGKAYANPNFTKLVAQAIQWAAQ